MERLENEVTVVHERLTEMSNGLENMNKDVGEKLSDTHVRLEGLENGIEVMKGYLRDLKEVMIGKEGDDKGKTLMNPRPSTFPTSDCGNTTPNERN